MSRARHSITEDRVGITSIANGFCDYKWLLPSRALDPVVPPPLPGHHFRSPVLSVKIVAKDFLFYRYQQFRLYLQRLLHGVEFAQPDHLPGNAVKPVKEIPGRSITIPESYQRLSHSYSHHREAAFPTERVFSYSPKEDLTIREGRFVEIATNRYLDVGKQATHRWPSLERRFESKSSPTEELLVIPWGAGSASYGDFLIQYLPKLARLFAVLSEEERAKAGICLNAFHHYPWAMPLMELLGVRKERTINGLSEMTLPRGGRLIIGSGSLSTHGIAHPDDISEFLKQVAPRIPSPEKPAWRKIYISRKMGRRMANEDVLTAGLESRGFEIIGLEDLGLPEQIRTFQESAIIAGPHGAGHANIMWSQPGTHLLEIFNPSWMHPCYSLLAEMKGIHYHCLVGKDGGSTGNWNTRSRFGIFENPEIDPEVFFRKIDSLVAT